MILCAIKETMRNKMVIMAVVMEQSDISGCNGRQALWGTLNPLNPYLSSLERLSYTTFRNQFLLKLVKSNLVLLAE